MAAYEGEGSGAGRENLSNATERAAAVQNSYKRMPFGLLCGLVLFAAPAVAATAAVPVTPQVSARQRGSAPSAFSDIERRAAAQQGLSERDKTFLMNAAQSQMLQVESSRVAIKRTRNPAIRRFAEATLSFMSRTQSRLEGIANEFGVSLPKIPPDEVQNANQALDKSPDPDREYLRGILADTTKISGLYKDESSSAKNPVLARYAQEALPRLRQHSRNVGELLGRQRG